jgi:hypothetical protein
MGIRSKPQHASVVNEERVNALIEKGGTVATSNARRNEVKPIMLVQLRLSRDVIKRIDRARKLRRVPPSRHSWMLEAILEKLES